MHLLEGGCDAGNKLFMSKGATVTAANDGTRSNGTVIGSYVLWDKSTDRTLGCTVAGRTR